MKLRRSLVSTYLSPSPLEASELLSLKRNFSEFELFSFHIRSAIDDHVRVKEGSLPLNPYDFKNYGYPHSLNNIYMFHLSLTILAGILEECMDSLEVAISDAGYNLEFNIGWSYLLSILKELNNIAKLYDNGEKLLSLAFRQFPLAMSYLIWHLKKGDDHLWLLKYDSAIDFESRRHLMRMMLPELEDDGRELHKILIDRSHLLKESFEHIILVKAGSLHNGLSVEFKDEVATGHGVMREWLFLVCQALFGPEYSLFVEYPEDRCRFFPNPAQVKPRRLKYFAFCGQVIALALMHEVNVGIAFDRVFFLHLAEGKISLEDIRCADPIMYRSCKNILEMDADLVDSDVMGLRFVREIEEFGSRKTVELCPGGINIVLNSKNREQYVHLLIQHIYVKSNVSKGCIF
ncbi:E3 ubiquitin-protein ligase UPL5-like [Papaver somniferum]|uniref:E3 ubiquitin-protein ligase UPL5-like n=1 Tax=Papaver somniferum TaxID=3469 RepID=UPI000E6FD5AA|nr:E3 ubiquitin-protein ligase UPL5-like [Papaver somniferum]